MGNFLSIFSRFVDYPLKTTRQCAYEPEFPQKDLQENTSSEYDKIVNEFETKLLDKRMEVLTGIDGKTWEKQKLLTNFPDLSESTISYLHSIFLTFCNENNKLIDFDAFSCILMCLYFYVETGKRRDRFSVLDSDKDGFIDFNEFLEFIYNYDNLGMLAKFVADRTRIINNLSIGQQLEYGLF